MSIHKSIYINIYDKYIYIFIRRFMQWVDDKRKIKILTNADTPEVYIYTYICEHIYIYIYICIYVSIFI
jgi:hypothetical protein